MNLYILVEGKCTEFKLYPAWLSVLLPKFERVYSFDEVEQNNYYIVSGYGIPSLIKNHLPNAILDVAKLKEKYDYLVVVVDAEELSVEQRKSEVAEVQRRYKQQLGDVKVQVVVQNRCIETWLLGNREMIPPSPKREKLKRYIDYYDINFNNPENMPNYVDDTDAREEGPHFSTTARFHTDYLQEVFKEQNMVYTKRNPRYASNEQFLKGLMRRVMYDPADLVTFQEFLSFCETVSEN
ncbi:hypothetical protein L21SP3_01542 [Sedimentisphaera cyanobacteriorum]|uniref:DUF4276 domain-containing protein n=1 Tax=Sedimentisphaera cyanobacteriorum TaxID=1940790 RepID=A0A1Q2HQS0_9BACT|nr:DUF4276 family protein [Sedimentisphaera cyanobacteriorum]AQQ09730.1 hypothetical protein L21SP3_01542 [Sedimentisphaera cyanobacteriorum]